MIHEQIVRLERFKTEDLAEVDAIDHDASALGRETKPDPTVRLIRRYKAAAQREMDKAQAELERLQARAAEEARKAAELAREAMLIARRIPEAMLIIPPRPPTAAVPAEAPAAPAAAETPTSPPASESTATPELETVAALDVTVVDSTPSLDPAFEAELRRVFPKERPLRGRARRRQELRQPGSPQRSPPLSRDRVRVDVPFGRCRGARPGGQPGRRPFAPRRGGAKRTGSRCRSTRQLPQTVQAGGACGASG